MRRNSLQGKRTGLQRRGVQTSGGLYQPFKILDSLVKHQRLLLPTKPNSPRQGQEEDDHLLFQEAMRQVRPLPQRGAYVVPPQPPRPGTPVSHKNDELEALTQLTELVAGKAEFDFSLTDEYLEGHIPSLDPRIIAALKAGAFPIQDHLDLHGLNVTQARDCLENFLARSRARGYRTVLIIHGRGRGSPDHIPVLKTHLRSWLTWKRFRRQVLAFVTAQPYDGGTGALYLLLRRLKTV